MFIQSSMSVRRSGEPGRVCPEKFFPDPLCFAVRRNTSFMRFKLPYFASRLVDIHYLAAFGAGPGPPKANLRSQFGHKV